MCARQSRAPRGRPRQSIPQALPDDLYDYAADPMPAAPGGLGTTSLMSSDCRSSMTGRRRCQSQRPRSTSSSGISATYSTVCSTLSMPTQAMRPCLCYHLMVTESHERGS